MPSTSIPSYTQLTLSPAYSISQDSQITHSEKRPCLKLDWVSELSEYSLNVYYFIEAQKPVKVTANKSKTVSTVQILQNLYCFITSFRENEFSAEEVSVLRTNKSKKEDLTITKCNFLQL